MSDKKDLYTRMAQHLDTRDKRWMFLKCFFPNEVGHVNLEGNPLTTCFTIVDRFSKQSDSYLQELEDKFEEVFES